MSEEQTRQQAWVDRNKVKFRSVALKPEYFERVTKLKDNNNITLLDIVKEGLKVYERKFKIK